MADSDTTGDVKSADEEYLDALLGQVEGNRLEFKEASESYDTRKATGYCAALANEGGGHLILGVTDKIPRRVVGSKAIRDPASLEHSIFVALKVFFQIPSRMKGVPIGRPTKAAS